MTDDVVKSHAKNDVEWLLSSPAYDPARATKRQRLDYLEHVIAALKEHTEAI